MIAASSSEAFRNITRLDTESRDQIARVLADTFASRGLTLFDIERAILDAFGTFVQIKTWGRETGTIQLRWSEIGVPEKSQRASLLKASKFNPLPAEGLKEIAALFEQVRDFSRSLGVWMPEYRYFYIPLVEWTLWQEHLAEARVKLDLAKQRHFGVRLTETRQAEVLDFLTDLEARQRHIRSNARKAALRQEIRQRIEDDIADYNAVKAIGMENARVIAEEAYAGLIDQGITLEKSREAFIQAMASTAESVYPTEDEIRSDIGFSWLTVKATDQEVIDVVVANRDLLQHETMREMPPEEKENMLEARTAERLVREAMIRERQEIWLIQAQKSSLLDELTMSAGKELVVLADSLGKQIVPLSAGNSRKLNGMLRNWLHAVGMISSSKRADALCERALEIQSKKLGKSDLDALFDTLRELAGELNRLAQRKSMPASGLGVGLVPLEDSEYE